jgi:hypothetical protein
MNVDEFDTLLEVVRSENISVTEIIEKAKIDDSSHDTKKFMFSLHLSDGRKKLKIPSI